MPSVSPPAASQPAAPLWSDGAGECKRSIKYGCAIQTFTFQTSSESLSYTNKYEREKKGSSSSQFICPAAPGNTSIIQSVDHEVPQGWLLFGRPKSLAGRKNSDLVAGYKTYCRLSISRVITRKSNTPSEHERENNGKIVQGKRCVHNCP